MFEPPQKKKRIRTKPNNQWTKANLDVLLQCVLFSKNSFEKPTAQIFYRKILDEEPTLEGYDWCGLRDKMRNLRRKYHDAIDWRNGMGARTTEEDNEETVQGYILKLCPEFEIMDELFGSKSRTDPLYISDNGVPENENIIIEYLKSDDYEIADSQENRTVQNQEESVDEPEQFIAQQFTESLDTRPSTSGTPKSRASASINKYKKSSTYLTQAKEARVAQLAESRKEQTRIDEKKLELEALKASNDAEIRKQQLKLEESRLQFEIDKWKEQSKLTEMEIEKKFEMERFRIEKEIELKKYELDLKYKSDSQ